jgi:hypothetical protein
MAGTSLLFTVARQREGKVQLSPDILGEFGGFFVSGFVSGFGLNPVDDARCGHEAILRLLR